MTNLRAGVLILLSLFVLQLTTSCAEREPFEYRSNLEVPKGPGLFSGDKGGLVLIGD